jgi:hypothetical protein
MSPRSRLLSRALGLVLILGGLAHSGGVVHLYATKGFPDLNRVLLDVWIAEAHLVAGILFVLAGGREAPRAFIVGGSAVLLTWAIPFLPVVVHRDPLVFRIPHLLYSASAVALLLASGRPARG